MPRYAGLFCDRCKGVIVTCDVGTCTECGKGTSSGMHQLCYSCAEKLQRCTHCGKPVSARELFTHQEDENMMRQIDAAIEAQEAKDGEAKGS